MAFSIEDIKSKKKQNKILSEGFDFSKLLQTEFNFFNSLGSKDKLQFYEELHLLFSAGLDIDSTLDLMIKQSKDKSKVNNLLVQIRDNIVLGDGLSIAMKKSKQFSDYEYYSIQIGEETGNLEPVLNELRSFYDQIIEQRKKLISALSYPCIVLFVAIGAVYFLLQFVVPLFEDVFKRFNGELPGVTKFIINLSEGMSNFVPIILIVTFSFSLILYLYRKEIIVRHYGSKIILKLPIIGELVRSVFMARLFTALHLLVRSRNPLNSSLSMVQKMIGFFPIEQALKEVELEVLAGKSLFESLEKHKIFDDQTITLIKVAEEVGQLEIVLGKLCNNVTKDVNHKMNTLGSLIEPILIIGVGSIVAFILIAMYLPLFQLSTSVY